MDFAIPGATLVGKKFLDTLKFYSIQSIAIIFIAIKYLPENFFGSISSTHTNGNDLVVYYNKRQ